MRIGEGENKGYVVGTQISETIKFCLNQIFILHEEELNIFEKIMMLRFQFCIA